MRHSRVLSRALCSGLLVHSLSACAPGASALARSLEMVWDPNAAAERTSLSPNLRYMRVVVDGRTVFLVLGYVEPNALGPIEIWYSAKGEVIKLQNGRIVGTAGLGTDWRDVRLPAIPAWAEIQNSPLQYERQRDQMPGYRFSIQEFVILRAINAPTDSALIGVSPQGLTWFEESVRPLQQSTPSRSSTRAARYAVDSRNGTERVIYGEQCLTESLCLTWQQWPAPPKAGTVN